MTAHILWLSMNYIKVRHIINEFKARDIDRQQSSHFPCQCAIRRSDRHVSPNQPRRLSVPRAQATKCDTRTPSHNTYKVIFFLYTQILIINYSTFCDRKPFMQAGTLHFWKTFTFGLFKGLNGSNLSLKIVMELTCLSIYMISFIS